MKLRRWTRELRDFLLPLHGGASAAEQRSRLTVNEQLLREQDREHTRELWRISLMGVARSKYCRNPGCSTSARYLLKELTDRRSIASTQAGSGMRSCTRA